jgi:PAS domain S-box-containing protein
MFSANEEVAWSLSRRPVIFGLFVGLLMMSVSLLSIAFLERGAQDSLHLVMRRDLLRTAELARTLVDADTVAHIVKGKRVEGSATDRAARGMAKALRSSPDIHFMYVLAVDGDSVRFVLDGSSDSSDARGVNLHAKLWEAYPQPTAAMLEALRSQASMAEETPNTDKWGTDISGYAPLWDSKGVFVGIVGVDLHPEVYMERLETIQTRALLASTVMVFFALLSGFYAGFSLHRRDRQDRDRQETNRRILVSEEMYRTLFETSGSGIVVYGEDQVIRMMNGISEDLCGWLREDVEGKRAWTDFIHPDDMGWMLENAVLRNDNFRAAPRQYDCRIQHKDGGIRHCTISVSQIPRTRQFVAALMDRTRLIDTYRQLEESQERYRIIFDVTNTPMMVFDENNQIRLANAECLRLANRSYVDMQNVSWTDFIHPEDLPRVLAFQQQAEETGPWHIALRIFDGYGQIKHLSMVISRLPGSTWCIATGIDLTERIQAETALQTLNWDLDAMVQKRTEELERALRSREEFLSSMSHELRTPLQSIQSASELLKDERLAVPLLPDQERQVNTIQRSAVHLLSLISDILDLAKSMAGHLELRLQTVNAAQVVREAMDILGPAASQQGVVVGMRCEPENPGVLADPVRLRQILVNLLGNAVKFTPKGGQVWVDVLGNDGEGRLHFEVSDNGIGIALEDQKKLFRPFVQLDNSLSRHHAGTGLGLALVRRLVDAHKGELQLDSQPGQGTRVRVSLPWEGETTEFPALDESSVSDAFEQDDDTSMRVLIAEDNEDIRECVVEYLNAMGCEIEAVGNGQLALDAVSRRIPDVILMDVQMPIMDGLEAIGHLRRNPLTSSLPIIAMTAMAQSSDAKRCLDAGATSYLTKPVRLKELLATIEGFRGKGKDPSNETTLSDL